MNDPIRAALAPFAAITEDDFKGSIFEGKPDDTEVLHFHASGKEITMGDFRRARAALAAPAARPEHDPKALIDAARQAGWTFLRGADGRYTLQQLPPAHAQSAAPQAVGVRHDVTSDFYACLIQMAESHDWSFTITSNGQAAYEVTVKVAGGGEA